jgi:membrane associated rhomboid family serine protease
MPRAPSDCDNFVVVRLTGRIPDAPGYSRRPVIPLKDDVPVSRPPVLTIGLIGVNVAAFLWQLTVGLPYSVQVAGLLPYEVLALKDVAPPDLVPPPLTILTSMFLHGGFMHIAGNMLFLWIFGNNVEDVLGRGRFLVFYLACGVAAALSQVAVSALSPDPSSLLVPMVGASGAIAGVLAAYMVTFPRARVLTLVPIFFFIRLIYVPAAFFIGLWFVIQLVSAVLGSEGSGVAFVAHVGGFLAGWLLIKVLSPGPRWRAGRTGW